MKSRVKDRRVGVAALARSLDPSEHRRTPPIEDRDRCTLEGDGRPELEHRDREHIPADLGHHDVADSVTSWPDSDDAADSGLFWS